MTIVSGIVTTLAVMLKENPTELENLSEIRDRTILKLFEADSSGRGPSGLGPSGLPPITNADDEAAAVAMQQQQQQHTVV